MGQKAPFRGAIAAVRSLYCFTGGVKSEKGGAMRSNDVAIQLKK